MDEQSLDELGRFKGHHNELEKESKRSFEEVHSLNPSLCFATGVE